MANEIEEARAGLSTIISRETKLIKNIQSSNKWYILILAALTGSLGVAAQGICMPVLFKQISEALGLSLVQVGSVWGMVYLAGFSTHLINGMLGDRLGYKRVMALSCFLVGIAGAFRGLSYDFISLAATAFVYGVFSSMIVVNQTKVAKIWFPREKLALANGVLATGYSLGFTLGAMISATLLSPWLGGWRNVLFLYGSISVILGILWHFTVREPERDPLSDGPPTVPMRRALSHVIHLRSVWILGFVFLGYNGALQGIIGYLPLYLRNIGWPAVNADGTLAAFNLAGAFGAIPIALLSDRLGLRKVLLSVLIVAAIVGTALIPFFESGLVSFLAIMVGFTRDPSMVLLFVLTMESRGVSVAYFGTAIGLIQTISSIGAAISPPVGNSLASLSLGSPYFFWAALAVMAWIVLRFAEETGYRGALGKG